MKEEHPDIWENGPAADMEVALATEEQKYGGRFRWDGEWPGIDACRQLDLWCYWGERLSGKPTEHNNGVPGRWVPCEKDHPKATEDLNTLHVVAAWNKHTRQWEKSPMNMIAEGMRTLLQPMAECGTCSSDAKGPGLHINNRIRALKQITEGGVVGDPNATFPQAGFIHAERGDKGTVRHVDHDGALTVRFDHMGTATIVLPYEIEPITPENKYLEEIHDENGPTGQFVDMREIRMDDEGFFPDVLDDGIRQTVLWLRANGFKTFDSGDGKKDHLCAHKFPNVWMEATRENAFAETDRLGELLEQHGIELNPDGGADLDMTYEPRMGPVIRLFGVDDAMLREHGVIARATAP